MTTAPPGGSAASASISAQGSGARTSTVAPAADSSSAFQAAASLPPTTTAAPAAEHEEQRKRRQPVHAARTLETGGSRTEHVRRAHAQPPWRAIRRRISGMQEPQLVPAPSCRPIFSTLRLPAAAAASIRRAPTWKHTHTVGPSSTAPSTGHPASRSRRSLGSNGRQLEPGLEPIGRRQLRARATNTSASRRPSLQHGGAIGARGGIVEGHGVAGRQGRAQPRAPARRRRIQREVEDVAEACACPRPIGESGGLQALARQQEAVVRRGQRSDARRRRLGLGLAGEGIGRRLHQRADAAR